MTGRGCGSGRGLNREQPHAAPEIGGLLKAKSLEIDANPLEGGSPGEGIPDEEVGDKIEEQITSEPTSAGGGDGSQTGAGARGEAES